MGNTFYAKGIETSDDSTMVYVGNAAVYLPPEAAVLNAEEKCCFMEEENDKFGY